MIKANFYLVNVVFLLVFNSKMLYSQDTVIVGKAHNAKYGAVVVSSNDEVYYIDKLKSWGPDFYEKAIKVVGRVVVKRLKKIDNSKTGITSPFINIIKNAQIQVLPDG